jgi:ATP-binding cassette subfamily F protein 3
MTYQMNNAIIGYPGNRLLECVSMEIRNKEKIAIVGRNGCGKTTLLKVIAGKLEVDNLDSDEEFFIHMDGKPSIGYLEQMSFEQEEITVREELLKVYDTMFRLKDRLQELETTMETDCCERVLNEYTKVLERFELLGGYSYQTEMEQIFTKFGFPIEDLDRVIATFSGGQKTKIAFVKLLLSKPDIMLLDEPTNHLDLATIEWLEGYLKKYPHAVVIVSHDRMFLDRVIDITYEIEYKKMKRYVGNYTAFLKQKRLDYEKQCKDYEAQQKEIERLTIFIEKWKNTPTKVAMTRSKRMQIEHMEKIPKPRRFDERKFHTHFLPHRESASLVLDAKDLQIGYDKPLAQVTVQLHKGDKLAILGENGIGKSTLLKTLVRQLKELGGDFHYGRDVDWVYFDQELLNLDNNKTVIEEFWDEYPKLNRTEVRTILGNFLFSEEEVFKPIVQLSGGERVRLSLAKIMKKQANLLILDEPTNHLDMAAKDALEAMILEFTGTVLFVSHDRYFIQTIANRLLIFEQDQVNFHPYDYDRYQELKARAEGKVVNGEGDETLDFEAKGNLKATKENSGYNKAKKERKLKLLEQEISGLEEQISELKRRFTDPMISSDFEMLDSIHTEIESSESKLNKLLEEWEQFGELD